MKIDFKSLSFLFLQNLFVRMTFVFAFVFVLQLFLIPSSQAGGLGAVSGGLATTGKVAGLSTQGDLPTIAGAVINQGLTIVGILLLAYLLYGGFYWMTARGDDGKVKTAVGIIRNAITGIVIIAFSFAIAQWVVGSLNTALTGISVK